ncbi:MAG: serine hydrolase domain-containing protein, partial [Mucilaginibacter sp.]
NYIVLAMIMEQVTGSKYYDLLRKRILQPYHLTQTKPSNQRKLPGLVQGYAGKDNDFGGRSEVIGEDGRFIINPQFEWTGGGIYSTSSDLAKWAKMLYEGLVFDPAMLPVMETGTPAKMLGANTSYGLGVIIRQSAKYGTSIGHSGFFPGYMTEMFYFPQYKIAFAVQTNTSDYRNMKISALKVLLEIAKTTFEDSQNSTK